MRSTTLLVFVSALTAVTPPAAACGGCFTAVTTDASKSAQVVTDHRMVLALSAERSTLWDQIRYAGSPEDFVWVLPIAPDADVEIGVADNAFMEALDSLSAPAIRASATSLCPGVPGSGGASGASGASGAGFGGGDYGGGCGGSSRSVDYVPGGSGSGNEQGDAAVSDPNEVVGRESAMVLPMGVFVVGPYAAAVVPSRGEGGFDEWMAGHGYDIPAPTRVAVEHYQSLGFDFLVLRLRPQQGVHQMQPVRVSFRGYVPTLPLRMIAAGVADKVGLSLMVLAHTEVQAMNFRTAFVADDDLVFDFAANRSNYRALFDAALGPRSDPAWVVESSEPVTAPMMSDRMPAPQDAGFRPSLDVTVATEPDAGLDAGPPSFSDLLTSGTFHVQNHRLVATLAPRPDAGLAASDPYVDRRIAFAHLPGTPYLTRLRTELDRVVLDRDLDLEPGRYGRIGQQRTARAVVNIPPCPDAGVPSFTTTTPPRASLLGCSVTVVRAPGVGLFGFAALAFGLRRWGARRRRG